MEATLRMPPRWRVTLSSETKRQIGERADIEVDHPELVAGGDGRRFAEQAEAGIVDDEIRLQPARAELIG